MLQVKIKPAIFALGILLLSGCGALPEWLGEGEEKPLDGKRIAINATTSKLEIDSSVAATEVVAPEGKKFAAWPQSVGIAEISMGNLESSIKKSFKTSKAGEGNSWPSNFIANIVSDGKVIYAMDSRGYVSAHSADDITKVIWKVNVEAQNSHDSFQGGGLALADESLIVVTGSGKIVCLQRNKGNEIWVRNIDYPVRSYPRYLNSKIFVSTLDNQTIALEADSGNIAWRHNGLTEQTAFLSSSTPAVTDGMIITAYSSGEVFGVRTESGREAWADLISPRSNKTIPGSITDVQADPVISGGIVYVAGSGQVSAFDAYNGRRIWDKDITAAYMPWVASRFMYIMNTKYQLICILKDTGQIKWIKDIFDEDKLKDIQKERPVMAGPFMINGELYIFSGNGKAYVADVKNGEIKESFNIEDGIMNPPIVVNGKAYAYTKSSKLVQFE